jgi:hypothetical protein
VNATTEIIFSDLLLSMPFSFYCQNLYGQKQESIVTSELNANAASNTTQRNLSNELQSIQNTSHKLKVVSSFFPIGEFVKKIGGD